MQDLLGTQVIQVMGHPPRNANGRAGLRYEITLANGQKPSTFKQEKANKAQGFIGQISDVRVSTSPDGKYLNFEDVAAPGGLPPLEANFGGSTASVIPVARPDAVQGTASQIPTAKTNDYNRQTNPEDAARMCRSASLSTAFAFFGSLYTGLGDVNGWDVQAAVAAAKTLAREIYSEVMGTAPAASGELAEVSVVSTPLQPSAQDVVAQVNEVLGKPAVAVGGPQW